MRLVKQRAGKTEVVHSCVPACLPDWLSRSVLCVCQEFWGSPVLEMQRLLIDMGVLHGYKMT